MNVKGLSIQDIINLEWNDVSKLTRKELSVVTSRLVSATNKRLRRLEASSLGESPAYKSLLTRTGESRLSVKGKKQGQLQRVFSEAKHFLTLKTSTIGGYKKVIKNIKSSISSRLDRDISSIDVSKLYSTLHKGQEMGLIDMRGSKGSENAVNYITEILERNPNKTIDEIIDNIEDWYQNMYEEEFDYDEDYDDFYIDDDF